MTDLALAQRIARSLVPVDLYAAYRHLDGKLRAAGWPATSPWWLGQLERFWTRHVRRMVANVGRRGGKSSTMCRVCVVEMLWGAHHITPGDVGVFPVVSVRMAEAEERLRTVAAILDVLGVPYERKADEIRLTHEPIAVRVYPAHARLAVGFTGIGALLDEVARWRDDETGANPARAVLSSLRPSMATQPGAHEYLVSSPWSTADAHWDAMQQGDDEQQCVCHATSWAANPTLTEEGTRRDEPDEPTWRREYCAEPMAATEERMFSSDLLAKCVQHYDLPRRPEPGDRTLCGADWGFVRNSSALVVAHLASSGTYHIAELMVRAPTTGQPLKPSEVAAEAAEVVVRHGGKLVMADVHYREAMDEHLRRHGCCQVPSPVDVASQYVRLRTLAAQGYLVMPPNEQLIRDLGDVKTAPRSGGGLRIVLPKRAGGAHADVVAALALATYQLEGPAALAAPAPPQRHPDEQALMDQVQARLDRARHVETWGGYGWRR